MLGYNCPMEILRKVYYASYGLNMDKKRFLTYLEGGTPPGALRTYAGSRDTSPPMEDSFMKVPGYELYFASQSSAWTGGIAFIRKRVSSYIFTRQYLITTEQLSDVIAQENGKEAPDPAYDIDMAKLAGGDTYEFPEGTYSRLVLLYKRYGVPVFTCTSAMRKSPTGPKDAYIATIARGLAQGSVDKTEILSYLSSAVNGTVSPAHLAVLLAGLTR